MASNSSQGIASVWGASIFVFICPVIYLDSATPEYVGIPIDWEYPTLNDFEDLAHLLDENTGRKIWVHCAKNMRVSAMIYLYHRLCKGYTEEASRRYLEQIWQPNEVWQNFIDATIELYV